jgi:HEAT repeat protein
VAEVGFVDGKLVDKSQVTSIEDAIKLLESNQDGSTEDKLLADRMVLDIDPTKRKEQLNRFARLLRSPDARARRVAAKLLGRGDDLDFVPDLIFALSEGEQDGQVLRIAENSLRILSRQLTTYILPREGPVTAADRVKAERYWQNWFLSIRPDYVFINQ